jgi:glucan phosphoethanolaminetransferase (alkaline phosphatase superfamily)
MRIETFTDFQKFTNAVMIIGFVVAFEFATSYMAYAFTLKLYNYDKHSLKTANPQKLSRFISTDTLGWLCVISFLLGVIGNIIFRVGPLVNRKDVTNAVIVVTIVMILLPIITSIMNFVIVCFSFDPLLFDMNRLMKKMILINSELSLCKSKMEEVESAIANFELLKVDAIAQYGREKIKAASLRSVLRTRIYQQETESILDKEKKKSAFDKRTRK